jgi:hypothetical protein
MPTAALIELGDICRFVAMAPLVMVVGVLAARHCVLAARNPAMTASRTEAASSRAR